ncbi:MAG TPA: hypothetical protein DCY20_10090 [Firmicutes bacterium]|nr:hypothetical protein [Bacillota bacterium]
MKKELIILRAMELEDAAFIYDLFQIPMYQPIFHEEKTSLETWKTRCLTMIQSPRSYDYIIHDPDINSDIGYVGLYQPSDEHEIELQVVVLDPDYCGQGVGTTVVDLLKQKFTDLKHDKMTVKTLAKNFKLKHFYAKNLFYEMGDEFIEEIDSDSFETYVKMECELKS